MSLTLGTRWIRLTPELKAKAKRLGKGRAVTKVMARQVQNDLRSHFARRHAQNPNKMGYPRSGFWLQVRSSVQQPVFRGETAAEVTIADPRFRQKVHGGTIVPKRKKALTIPVHPQAYNRRAGSISGLVYLPSVKGDRTAMLVMPVPNRGFPEVYYVLKKRVTQKADPKALPSFVWLRRNARRRAERFVNRAA